MKTAKKTKQTAKTSNTALKNTQTDNWKLRTGNTYNVNASVKWMITWAQGRYTKLKPSCWGTTHNGKIMTLTEYVNVRKNSSNITISATIVRPTKPPESSY